MTSAFSWQNSVSLCPFILYSKAKFACYSRYLSTSYFCIPVPYDEKGILFFDIHSRRSCRSSQNHSTSASLALIVGTQTWITMILNGLPLKQTEVIVSFLRLHPGTAFWTLQLTMIAIPFLLRDSCPQQQIEQLYKLNSPIPVHFSSLIPKMSVFILSFPV